MVKASFRGRIGHEGGVCIKLLRKNGFSMQKIARQLGISKSSVHRHLVALSTTPRQHRSGPTKDTIAFRNLVERVAKQQKVRVATVLQRHPQLKHASVSKIRRALRACSFRARVRPKGPQRMAGDEANRLKMSKYLLKHCCLLERIVWSDEKYFFLHDNGYRLSYCQPHEEPPAREQNDAISVHVWACIGPNGFKHMVILPRAEELGKRHGRYEVFQSKRKAGETRGRKPLPFHKKKKATHVRKGIDSEAYIDHVLVGLHQKWKKEYIFQQDGALCHHSLATTEWLKKRKIERLDSSIPWSKRSPDLSIIENAWSAIAWGVCRTGPPDSREELIKRVKSEFKGLDTKGLYASVGPRLKACVDAQGKTIGRRWRLRGARKEYEKWRAKA